MSHLVCFETALFDPGSEPENPINPIPGHSALTWLAATLASEVEMTAPMPEDWGWYSMARLGPSKYLVGASVAWEEPAPSPPFEWIIQIHKQRSIGERLLGRNRMAKEDPLVALIHATVRADERFSKVELRDRA